MSRSFFGVVLLALLSVPFNASYADTRSPNWPSLECQWYFADSSNVPPHIVKLWTDSRVAVAAVKACTTIRPSDRWAYFTARAARKSATGPCWYYLEQAFYDERESKWDWVPPSNYEFQTVLELYFGVFTEECPRHDNASYVLTHDMSEGVFLAFWRFWSDASSSPDALEKFVDESIKKSPGFLRLKEVIGDPRLRVGGIGSASPQLNGNAIVYHFGIDDFRYPRTGWGIEFDLTPGGIKILGIIYGSE